MPGSRSAAAVAPVVPVTRWHVLGARAFAAVAVVVLVAGAVSDGRLDTAPRVVLAVAGVVLATLAVWAGLRRRGRDGSERSVLLWPAAVLVLMVVLNLVSPLTAHELPGLFTLAFLFVGLSQRPGTVWWCLPVALVPYVWILQIDLDVSLVRIPVIVAVWTLVAEVPARLLGLLRVQAEELSRTASTDALTGLANRADLDRTLAALGPHDAVAIVDLDHFKRYNDTFGHPSGDVLLRDFADCLRESARSGDRLFRYGGEEFLLVLPRTTPAAAAGVLRRTAGRWQQTRPEVTFSAGVAAGAGRDPLGSADALLYQAKEQGRDRVLAQPDAVDPDAPEASLPQGTGS
ncbi:GGDEF domain-containing protein [Aeromicrobium massiliense]|uniref:GGDEF domain-containing protein n=1 Tax=Aeromicrobium massiliense TaxID=1464554 RepID=UPI0005784EE8|nr:GGDEF domain-containing protein [Aeromicrobium massiliense]